MSVLAVLLGIAALAIGKPTRLSSARETEKPTQAPAPAAWLARSRGSRARLVSPS